MRKIISLAGFFAVSVILAACGGSARSESEPTSVPTRVSEVSSTAVQASPTSAPAAATTVPSGGNRIKIPNIGVDAVVNRGSVGPDGKLVGSSPSEVTLQDFSGWPGSTYGGFPGSGNTILFGDFDKKVGCPAGQTACGAVFFDLKKLRRGNEIQLVWDQKVYTYTVSGLCNMPASSLDTIVRRTDSEQITLATWGGNLVNGGYTHVDFVVAEPTLTTDTPKCPEGAARGAARP